MIADKGIKEKDLLISGKQIEGIVSRDHCVSSDYQVLDCTDLYVSADFVDIHQHGGGGSDYMDDDPDAYLRVTSARLRHGTTFVMPTLLSADTATTLRAVEAYKTEKRDPRIKANPLGRISPLQAGVQKPEHIRSFDETEYRKIAEAAKGNIKRWSVAPEIAGADCFARFAKEQGIILSIAHTNADFDTVCSAFEQGYRHVPHLYSCCSTIVRKGGFRVPGVLEAAYYLDGMNVEVIADGCHLPKSLLSYVAKLKPQDTIALVTDVMRAAGQDVKRSFLGSMDDPLPVIIEDGVEKMDERSAFAGSIATADHLVRNMVGCGVSLQDAVKMITVNPLR